MSPLRRRKSRREARRDELSARLGRLPGEDPETHRRRLAEEERKAYARSRRERRRRARQAGRPRLRLPKLTDVRSASGTGLRATAEQAGPLTQRIGRGFGRLLAWLGAMVLRLFALAEAAVTLLLATGAAVGGRVVAFIARYATPARVMVGVIGGAAVCLVLSQFVAYRGVQVGQPDYASVASVVGPPERARVDAGEAHAYVLVPLAGLAFAVAAAALVTGRWRLGRLVALIGVAGIAVSLIIDLPKGLDAGTAGVAYAGARATMTEGFYAQLAASATLVLCGLLLAQMLRRAASPERQPTSPSRTRPRQAPSVAGGGT